MSLAIMVKVINCNRIGVRKSVQIHSPVLKSPKIQNRAQPATDNHHGSFILHSIYFSHKCICLNIDTDDAFE